MKSIWLPVLLSFLAHITATELNNQKIQELSQFVLKELQKLSDTGVYDSITIDKVISASTEIGVFHENFYLQISFRSPYFQSHEPTSIHDLIVMRHLQDNTWSFAIDEFPMMDPDVQEEFLIRKIEKRREMRKEKFEEILRETAKLPEQTEEFNRIYDMRIAEMRERLEDTQASQVEKDYIREVLSLKVDLMKGTESMDSHSTNSRTQSPEKSGSDFHDEL